MSSINKDCIEAAANAMQLFTHDELHQYVNDVLNKAKEYENMGGVASMKRAINEVNKVKMQELLEDSKATANDAQKTQRNSSFIKNKVMNLRETIVRRVKGLGNSIESAQNANKQLLAHSMFDEMDRDDLLYLQDRRNNQEIAEAHGGKDASPRAKKIAGIIAKYIDFRNEKMVISDAMSILNMRTDRYFKAAHNANMILRGGRNITRAARKMAKYDASISRESWKDQIKKNIDMEETFKETDAWDGLKQEVDEEKADRILNNIYDNITTGKSEIFTRSVAVNDAQAIARKSRMFFKWKDLSNMLEYNSKYGYGDLFSLMHSDINASANSIGLHEIYGTNPLRMLNDLRDVQQKVEPKGSEWNRETDLSLNHVMGADKLAVNAKRATFMANVNALTSMARLPLIAMQSLSDMAYSSGFARRWGFNYLSAYGEHLSHVFDLMKSDERKYLASLMKLSVDHHIGYMGRYTDAENASEFVQKLTTGFYKINGMTAFDKGNKLSIMAIIARGLHDASDKEWNALSDDTRNQLSKFIDENEWNVLRNNNKNRLFTVDNVNDLTNDQLKEIYEGSDKSVPLYQLKNDLYRKVHSIFDVASENAVLTPGAFAKAMMYQGLRPGTKGGDALRILMQFKGFPIAYMDRVLYQGYKDMGGARARIVYAAQMMATTLPLTYLSTYLGSLALGKNIGFNPMNWGLSDLISMINPNVSMASSVFDPHNQNHSMVSNILFNSPTLKLLSDSLAAVISLFEVKKPHYGHNVAKKFSDALGTIVPSKTTPLVSPMIDKLLGQK